MPWHEVGDDAAPRTDEAPKPPAAPRERARALLVLVACTAIAEGLHPWLEPANLIMVYLAGLVYVALRLGRAATLLAGVGSLLLFDLLFVEPRWSLKPTDPQYFLTFAVMAVVGIVISRLAEHSRAQTEKAEERALRAQAMYRLGLSLARARDAEAVGEALDAAVQGSLRARARLIDAETLRQPTATDDADVEAARALLAGTRADPHARMLPLPGGDGPLGVVVLHGCDGRTLGDEDRQLLHSFASQAAIALERVRFERLSAEAALAAEGERLRNTLLAGISHDFRTPLTTIIGAASSLLEQDAALDADRRRALLQHVLGEAQRLHALGSDLLDLTRLEAGAVRTECEWCPLDELAQEAWAALGNRTAGRTLDLQLPAEQLLWGDPRLIGQALANLFDNALRHSPPGTAVSVRAVPGDRELRLSVHDRGPGLAPGQDRKVFEKFFRAGGDGDRGGTGLGLAICAAVAVLHGGSISARNEVGACFEMRLPQPVPDRRAIDDGGAA